ncbi:hypothetical protein DUNSADRAFT_11235 [Dunaliella salina]|uniref:Uncharacterized protein n=1 Tax=Dunaliella salina TaxID=3046 RepID=A0ABQ7GDU8_DUNSA|nr:hypothetical protein DUNSADRAFT_11235 [Dunaliella salina]|eukprot:KAF5832777.1 hypothetical protein DUNSADRAFT_11235 [Dunaliella salina]
MEAVPHEEGIFLGLGTPVKLSTLHGTHRWQRRHILLILYTLRGNGKHSARNKRACNKRVTRVSSKTGHLHKPVKLPTLRGAHRWPRWHIPLTLNTLGRHVTKAAQGQQQRVAELLPVGSQVLAAVVNKRTRGGRASVELSIRALEQEPGQFLADPQAYAQHAERCLEQQQQQQQEESPQDAPTSGAPSLDSSLELPEGSDSPQRDSDSDSSVKAATSDSSTSSSTTAASDNSSSSSEGGAGPAPRMLRVPPPVAHVRVLAAAAKVLDEQANLGMLVEAAHSSSNQGEYADIAFELGKEFLKVSAHVDSATTAALQGDLPWSPNPPTPIALTTLPTNSSSSSNTDPSTNGSNISNASSTEAEAQQQQQQQQQQESFSHQLLAAPEQEGAELSADAWKRASAAQRALLASNLGLRMKSRALDAALAWQRLKRRRSRGSKGGRGTSKVTSPPTPKEGRVLLQRAAADARMDALALGTAPSVLPAQSHLAYLLANATDALTLLQPPPSAQQQASSTSSISSSGTLRVASRPRLFPTPLSGAPVSATAAAAAAAMGLENEQALGLAAEARNMWFAPAVPLLMDWAAGGRSSGAEVVASGVVPQCVIRGGMLGTLLPDVKAAGDLKRSQASTIHAFYDRLFSKIAKSMVPSRKVAAAVAKAHVSLVEKQQQQKLQYWKQQRGQAQEDEEPALPSPPPQPLQGALNLLWMGENVGAWRPSHDWWDAFLQRYAAVLPPGVSLFSSPPQESSSNGLRTAEDTKLEEGADGASAAAAEELQGEGSEGAEGVSETAMTGGQEGGSLEQEREQGRGGEGSSDEMENKEGGHKDEGEEKNVVQEVVREPWEVREARATAARLCRALRA